MEFLVDYIVELLFVLLTTFAGIGFTMLKKYLNKKWQIDIGNFVNNGEIVSALNTQMKKVKKTHGDSLNDYEFENEVVKNVVEFIDEQFPKWIKEYGFTPDMLENYVRNKFEEFTE